MKYMYFANEMEQITFVTVRIFNTLLQHVPSYMYLISPRLQYNR